MDAPDTIVDEITRKRLIWYGHVERMDPTRLPKIMINLLKPNDLYMRRTAPLTSRRCILNIQQIYILNILNMLHNLRFFSLQNAVYFTMLPFFGSCIICILHTGCAKI